MKKKNVHGYVFKVTIFLGDNIADNSYNVVAANDVEAREIAVKLDTEWWNKLPDPSEEPYPQIDYCEIGRICSLD